MPRNISIGVQGRDMILIRFIINRISSIMVSSLTSSSVDRTGPIKPKTMYLVCVASLRSTQHEGGGAKTSLLGFRKRCLGRATGMLRTVVSVN
jgi:hypothetical protein